MHTELANKTVTAKELTKYLEQDDRTVIVAPLEGRAVGGKIVSYSAAEFKKLATKEQRKRLKEVAYPEVLHWLSARGVAPEVKIVCLPGGLVGSEQIGKAASIIINEGLA